MPESVDVAVVHYSSTGTVSTIAKAIAGDVEEAGAHVRPREVAPQAAVDSAPAWAAHGGQESTLLALCDTVRHFGGVLVAPGSTDPSKFVDGNPYGTSHVSGQGGLPVGEETLTAARVQARRVVKSARAVKTQLAAEN